MSLKNEYDELVQKVIDQNVETSHQENEFCDSRLGIFNIIENANVKIIFSLKDKSCDVRRKANDNPVFCRNSNGEVYRVHGEFGRIKKDLEKLLITTK